MEKMDTAFRLQMMFDLQGTKLDLALETIEAIAMLGVKYSENGGSIPLNELIPILSGFTERMDDLCSEQV